MKRTLLMIMSILLAASSVFGIIAAGRGSDELSDIMRFKRGQKADIIDFVDVLDKRVADLRKAEENRTEDEKDYTESVVTDQKGNEQLSQGTQEYNAGAPSIRRQKSALTTARHSSTTPRLSATRRRPSSTPQRRHTSRRSSFLPLSTSTRRSR